MGKGPENAHLGSGAVAGFVESSSSCATFPFHSHCGSLCVDDGVGGGNQHCLVYIGCLLVSSLTSLSVSNVTDNTMGNYLYRRPFLFFIAN